MTLYHGTIRLFKQQHKIQGEWNDYGIRLVYQHLHGEVRNRVGDLIDRAKSEHDNNTIVQCCGDQRTIFKAMDGVVHRESVVFLTCTPNQEMAQKYDEFFREKDSQH
jgi:hypothetical protein